MDNISEAVLVSIRRIIRSSDLYSSHTRRHSGLSPAQILLLKAIQEKPEATAGQLARHISLSQATTTSLLDRLAAMGLIERYRSEVDRRRVHVHLTEQGKQVALAAPMPLQAQFTNQFESLKMHERTAILSALQHVAEMMEAPLPGGDEFLPESDPDRPQALLRHG